MKIFVGGIAASNFHWSVLLSLTEIRLWLVKHDEIWIEDEGLLDANERGRARRMRDVAKRRAFVTAHAVRRLLAAELLDGNVAAREVRFACNAHGKPDIVGQLFCNLSHADRLTLIGFARREPIGLDLVRTATFFPIREEFSARFRFRENSSADWAGQEACGKVSGRGLLDAMDTSRFQTFLLEAAPGYLACAAAVQPSALKTIRLENFSPCLR